MGGAARTSRRSDGTEWSRHRRWPRSDGGWSEKRRTDPPLEEEEQKRKEVKGQKHQRDDD